ncbi:MAG: carboxymuconolactone decarboxylase family protein [Chloroflexi bacterium]|nr:carboxymuconolactone decarboxylase family protein [Chloroflexota bacterium]
MARVPYPGKEQLSEEQRKVYGAIEASRGRVAPPFLALLHSPQGAARLAAVGHYLTREAGLDPVVSDLAILATARENRNQFQFTAYVRRGRQEGVREEAIAAIRDGKAPAGLAPEEALPVRVAHELLREHGLHDETYQAAVKAYGLRKTVDLVLLVGYFTALGMGINALAVELEPGVKPEMPV